MSTFRAVPDRLRWRTPPLPVDFTRDRVPTVSSPGSRLTSPEAVKSRERSWSRDRSGKASGDMWPSTGLRAFKNGLHSDDSLTWDFVVLSPSECAKFDHKTLKGVSHANHLARGLTRLAAAGFRSDEADWGRNWFNRGLLPVKILLQIDDNAGRDVSDLAACWRATPDTLSWPADGNTRFWRQRLKADFLAGGSLTCNLYDQYLRWSFNFGPCLLIGGGLDTLCTDWPAGDLLATTTRPRDFVSYFLTRASCQFALLLTFFHEDSG